METAVSGSDGCQHQQPCPMAEHYRSPSDKNPIARAYVSNLRFYESLESLPEAYKATVDFRFNPEHGYVESKYYSKKNKY